MSEIVLAHDYLTQRGGAERVVAELLRAFPEAALHTTLHDPAGTFPIFDHVPVHTSPLNLVGPLRRHHTLAFPLLAGAVSIPVIDADVVIASSSGWAHGVRTTGAKIVYCHNPPRWLHQREDLSLSLRRRAALGLAAPLLRPWDRWAARSADRYVVNSTAVASRVGEVYGIDATVVVPPPGIGPDGPTTAISGVPTEFVLSVGRLLPYKHVDVIAAACARLGLPLVVVGDGPERDNVLAHLGPLGHHVGGVDDRQLRWLYQHARVLASASQEDLGLTPLEANRFGVGVATLRGGGFLDTVVDGTTGVFFDRVDAASAAPAIEAAWRHGWDRDALVAHAERFSPDRFARAMRAIVDETLR